MEATSGTQERALSSDKAVRIVEAMRESVGEVGIVGVARYLLSAD